MSIPLKVRKIIKEATTKCEESLKKAGDSVGVTLTFIDNLAEVHGILEDELVEHVPAYFAQLEVVFAEFAAQETRKESLVECLTKVGGKVGLRIVSADVYYEIDGDGFWLAATKSSFGSWLSYWDSPRLELLLQATLDGHPVPLIVKRSLVEALPVIQGHVTRASAAYGQTIVWAVDHGEAWQHLQETDPAAFGLNASLYAEQFANMFISFISSPDNKEAVMDTWKTSQLKFNVDPASSGYTYWKWKDGDLYFDISPSYYGLWISKFDGASFEATL